MTDIFRVTNPLFVSQQVQYFDGLSYGCSINYISKDPNRSIGEEIKSNPGASIWTLRMYAKFE